MHNALDVLIRRKKEDINYLPSVNIEDTITENLNAARFNLLILSEINRVRAATGMAPLLFVEDQSRVAKTLAPHFFAANFRSNESSHSAVADRLALGLMAGWDVRGAIRQGRTMAMLCAPGQEAGEWIANALEQAAGRQVLLDPAARSIAIGPLVNLQPGALGALITTYSFFDGTYHESDAIRFVEQVGQERARRDLPTLVFLKELSNRMAEQAGSLHGLRGYSPQSTLHNMLNSLSLGRYASYAGGGLWIQTTRLDLIELPRVLLQPGSLMLAVAVTHVRPPGAAWARYVVFILALHHRGTST